MARPKKTAPKPKVEDTIAQRHQTHGDFRDVSRVSQELKAIIMVSKNFRDGKLSHLHVEGLEMIFHKAARILSGDPNFAEHWHDIAGYASRVEGML